MSATCCAVKVREAQTKFVLQKALQHEHMRPLVVINKVHYRAAVQAHARTLSSQQPCDIRPKPSADCIRA
eukprot:687157-Amphidinium_carterae.1